MNTKYKIFVLSAVLALSILGWNIVSAQADLPLVLQKQFLILFNSVSKFFEKYPEAQNKYPFIIISPDNRVYIEGATVDVIDPDRWAVDIKGIQLFVDISAVSNTSPLQLGSVVSIKGFWNSDKKTVIAQSINRMSSSANPGANEAIRGLIELLKNNGIPIPASLQSYQ